MQMTVDQFVNGCDDIIIAKPKYELGCSDTKKCDCIGMVKYSARKNNVAFSTSGTNDTFRTKVTNIRKLSSVSVLKRGDVVFKAKNPDASGYNLPSKYKKGGSGYNGDLTDYTHIGVVKSVNPLKIIHMTSPTSKTDTVIGNWKYTAELNIVNYNSGSDIEDGKDKVVSNKAIVVAEKGLWVKMRAQPTTKCSLYDNIAVGSEVTILSENGDWVQISYGKRKGWYMMSKFLKKK